MVNTKLDSTSEIILKTCILPLVTPYNQQLSLVRLQKKLNSSPQKDVSKTYQLIKGIHSILYFVHMTACIMVSFDCHEFKDLPLGFKNRFITTDN